MFLTDITLKSLCLYLRPCRIGGVSKKGRGKNINWFTNNFCREKGVEEVFVQAEKMDDYVLDFYRSTQPTNQEEAIHFFYQLNY